MKCKGCHYCRSFKDKILDFIMGVFYPPLWSISSDCYLLKDIRYNEECEYFKPQEKLNEFESLKQKIFEEFGEF